MHCNYYHYIIISYFLFFNNCNNNNIIFNGKEEKGNDAKVVEAVIITSSSSSSSSSSTSNNNIGTRLTGEGSRHPKRSIFYNITKKNNFNGTKILKQYQYQENDNNDTTSSNLFIELIENDQDDKNNNNNDSNNNKEVILNIIESNNNTKIKAKTTRTRIQLSSKYNPITLQNELNCNIILDKNKEKNKGKKKSKIVPIDGIYGIYNLPYEEEEYNIQNTTNNTATATANNNLYLVLIYNSNIIINIPNIITLKHIQSMEIIKLPNNLNNVPTKEKDRLKLTEYDQLRLLRKIIRQHELYYTTTCNENNVVNDVTHTLQRSFMHGNNTIKKLIKPDERFYWNEQLQLPIKNAFQSNKKLNKCISNHNILPICTSAYIGIYNDISYIPEQHNNYTQIVISRRSKNMQGTRYTKRGADAKGNVANFVETEQILLLQNEIYSFVQIRGSIPLLWTSPATITPYNPKVTIELNPSKQIFIFYLHLKQLWDVYGKNDIVFMNLIDKYYSSSASKNDDTENDQSRLGHVFYNTFLTIMDIINNNNTTSPTIKPKASFIWFDFHKECSGKNKNKHLINLLLYTIQEKLKLHGYFSFNLQEHQIKSIQNGVIRTNCMDCLDRTNVIQTIFARYVLFQQLYTRLASTTTTTSTLKKEKTKKHHKKRTFTLSKKMPIQYIKQYKITKNPLVLPWTNGEKYHRHIWANNADHIAILYSGTNALKGDYVRYGKRTTKGKIDDGINSLSRFYINNFLDRKKQFGIDLMIGVNDNDNDNDHLFINDSLTINNVLSFINNNALSSSTSSTNEQQHMKKMIPIKRKKYYYYHPSTTFHIIISNMMQILLFSLLSMLQQEEQKLFSLLLLKEKKLLSNLFNPKLFLSSEKQLFRQNDSSNSNKSMIAFVMINVIMSLFIGLYYYLSF